MTFGQKSLHFLIFGLVFSGAFTGCRYSGSQGTQLIRPTFVAANHYGAVDGKAIGYDDLDNASRRQIYQMKAAIYDKERKALEERVTASLLEKEAARRSVTVSELLNYEVFEPLAKKSAKDIDQFLKDNAGEIDALVKERTAKWAEASGSAEDLASVMPGVLQETLLRREGALALTQYLEKLKAQANVQIFLYPPAPLRQKISFQRSPHLGQLEATVKVFGLMSYGDDLSAIFHHHLKEEAKAQGGRLLYVWLHAPKNDDPFIRKVHGLSVCVFDMASSIDQFWKFHEALLAVGSKLAEPDLEKAIATAGLKKEVLTECLRPVYQATAQAILKRDEAVRLDVAAPASPVFYINGVEVRGIAGETAFRLVLEQELKSNYFVSVEKLPGALKQ